jgi:hypothetical protein
MQDARPAEEERTIGSLKLRTAIGLVGLLAVTAAGCGSSGHGATTSARPPTPVGLLKACLRRDGYTLAPETAADVRTAPRRFEFTAVWNVVNPSRVALALAFSKTTGGAARGAAWVRRTNAKISRGAVSAPVVRIGKIDVLWTAKPGVRNLDDVYGCIRRSA